MIDYGDPESRRLVRVADEVAKFYGPDHSVTEYARIAAGLAILVETPHNVPPQESNN